MNVLGERKLQFFQEVINAYDGYRRENFMVFFYDFIRDAQDVVALQKGLPHLMITVARRNGHNQAVCIEYNMLHGTIIYKVSVHAGVGSPPPFAHSMRPFPIVCQFLLPPGG